MQLVSAFEGLGPSDGVWSFMRVPGSAAALVAALEQGTNAGDGNLSMIENLLDAVTLPLLQIIGLPGPRTPATDEVVAAWCAAALRAGALPALRRVMATAGRGSNIPACRVCAAAAVVTFALMAAEPVAAAASAASAATGGAGNDGTPEQPPDDVAMAFQVLLGCVTGAPACQGRGAPAAPGWRRGKRAGRAACVAGPAMGARRCGRSSANASSPSYARCVVPPL
jgi:hypothetical protein